jgi:integrase
VAVWGHFLGEDWKIKQFKDKAAIKSTLSDEEIERIITMKPWYCRQSKEDFSRWSLFYKIMAYTGMRPGEVAHLTVDRVDFGRSVFCLEDTKTNEPRLVPISPALLPDLQSYIPTLTTSYLFARLRKGKVGDCVVGNEDWCYNFHVRLHRLGIKRPHLSVYSLRHSFITRLLEEDVNIFKVQKIVGHRRTDTTAVYTHLTTKDIVRTIEHDRLSWNKLDVHKKIEMIRDYIISLGLPTDQFETEITEHGIRVEIKAL